VERAPVIAYKFLAAGRVGPFSRRPWPAGEWVAVEGPLELCRNGVHASTVRALAVWLHDELWAVELAGEMEVADVVVVARRCRLRERVTAWDVPAARELAAASAAHARGFAAAGDAAASYAADAERYAASVESATDAAVVTYIGARAAEAAGTGGFARERAWQAGWLAERLALPAA
jgi:hypothetical protein